MPREHLPPPLGLLRLLARDVAADELLGPLDDLPLFLGRLRAHAVALGLQLAVRRVVARVVLEAAVRDLHDAVRDGVQEAPVVRDDERRQVRGRLALDEPVLEELHPRDVEVVRGLVEEKDGGVREKEARDLGAVLLPARELADGPVPHRTRGGPRRRGRGRCGSRPRSRRPARSARGPRRARGGGPRAARGRPRRRGPKSPPRGAASPSRPRAAAPAPARRRRGAAPRPRARPPARARQTSSRLRDSASRRRARRAPGRSSGRSTSPPRSGRRDPRSGRDRAATWRPRGRPSSRSSCGRFRAGKAPRGG